MRTLATLFLTAALGAPFLGAPALAQLGALDLLPPTPPGNLLDGFGADLAQLGDLDGDGTADFAVVVERGLLGATGHVQVTSGATRLPIGTLFPAGSSTSGMRVAGVGDTDLDGFPDVLLGLPRANDFSVADAGYAILYSGKLLYPIRTHVGLADDELGTAVCAIPDLNFDGAADYLIGVPGADNLFTGNDAGRVDVISGLDGAQEAAFLGFGPAERIGTTVALIGDAHFDLLEYSWATSGPGVDRVDLYYATTHQSSITGTAGSGFGAAIASAGDLDGDGLTEVAVGAPDEDLSGVFGSTLNTGRVRAFDAVSGVELRDEYGDGPDRRLGVSLANAGDLDDDGVEELLVGAEGAAYAFDDVWSDADGPVMLELQLASAGPAVVLGLDLDPSESFEEPLCALAFPGASAPDAGAGELQLRLPSAAPAGELIERLTSRSHSGFGTAVAALDDVDGDGVREVAIGIPFDDRNGAEAGAVEVRSGADGSLLYATFGAPGAQHGAALATVGDVDGDDLDDLAVGAPFSDGAFDPFSTGPVGVVTVYSAQTGLPLVTSIGPSLNCRFGAAVAPAGDVNEDGTLDVLVGAPWAEEIGPGGPVPGDREGRAIVFSTFIGFHFWSQSAVEPNASYGAVVANVGDLDGDGRDDLAISAPGRQSLGPTGDFGSVEVYSPGADAALWFAYGDQEEGGFGSALAAVGDVNLDGVGDVVVGAPGWDLDGPGGDPARGRLSVLSGVDGSVIGPINGQPGDRLGTSVAAAGDVDKDGKPDVAAGAPGFDAGTADALGRVQVFDADEATVLRSFIGSEPVRPLGASLWGGFDLDGDGEGELLAGAPAAPGGGGALSQAGAARVLSTIAVGTKSFGLGTPGCAGPHQLGLAAGAGIASQAEFRVDGIAPGLLPVLALSLGDDPLGSDPLGLGALMHVDVFGLFALANLPPTGVEPVVTSDVPVPDNDALVGLTFYAQVGFFWTGGCALVPGGFSSSTGLAVEIQP